MLTQGIFCLFLTGLCLTHVVFKLFGVTDEARILIFGTILVVVLYFIMSFLDKKGLLTVLRLQDWKGTISPHCVCTISASKWSNYLKVIWKKNPVSNILYSCLIYWLGEQWLFIDIVIIIMHWQQGPYTVFVFYLRWFFSMIGTFFFVFSVSVISLNF